MTPTDSAQALPKPPSEREPLLGAAVGKKGVGKTYQTIIMINNYVRGNPGLGIPARRALIIDANDEFSHIKPIDPKDVIRFCVHPIIEARRIRPFHPDGRKWTLSDMQNALFKVLEEFRGGLLLIEDISKYISDNLPHDVIGAICTNRHTDTDIIMHYQSIGRITTKIWQNINWIRFHKNTDSVDRHKVKFEDKYDMLKMVEIMVNNRYHNHDDKRFFLYVDIDNEKILGDYTEEMFDEAVTEFISENHNRLMRPMLNQITQSGQKKHTQTSALAEIKAKIRKNHSKF